MDDIKWGYLWYIFMASSFPNITVCTIKMLSSLRPSTGKWEVVVLPQSNIKDIKDMWHSARDMEITNMLRYEEIYILNWHLIHWVGLLHTIKHRSGEWLLTKGECQSIDQIRWPKITLNTIKALRHCFQKKNSNPAVLAS